MLPRIISIVDHYSYNQTCQARSVDRVDFLVTTIAAMLFLSVVCIFINGMTKLRLYRAVTTTTPVINVVIQPHKHCIVRGRA